jgi:hypothetical protein
VDSDPADNPYPEPDPELDLDLDLDRALPQDPFPEWAEFQTAYDRPGLPMPRQRRETPFPWLGGEALEQAARRR